MAGAAEQSKELVHPEAGLAEHDSVYLVYQEMGWNDRAVIAWAEAIAARAARNRWEKFVELTGNLIASTVQYQGETYVLGTGIAYTIAWRGL